MQLEAGKKYVDRRGRVYGPLVAVGASCFGEGPDDYAWTPSGHRSNGPILTDADLVAEYVEPAPAESPDDWVMLPPKHVLRRCVDFIQYDGDLSGPWHAVLGAAGMTVKNWVYAARCRRKDLPPLPPKTRTVVLKEWICWDDCAPGVYTFDWCSVDPTLEHGKYTEFDHAIATGNERTVEVPCGRE
jgi:hypothetical protein